MARPPLLPADSTGVAELDDSPPRRHTSVVAVLTVGLSLLVAIDGPRVWGTFARLLLPVLALSLAGTFAACLAVPGRAAGRLAGYPMACSLGGLLGGLAGLCCTSLLVGRSLPVMMARPIAWHLVLGSLVTGSLVGGTLWWLHHLRRHDHRSARQLSDSRAELLRVRTEAAEADAARSRIALQLLQAQIEPHFLYNALANLRYLVRHDADLALRLVDQLVRYFRVVLPSLREVEVSLAQELELCEAFGAIQALRIGGLLRLDVEAADDLRAARLPPAVVLTLVENAFKHGAPPPGVMAHVKIAARRIGAQLHVSVIDNGCRGDPAPGAAEPGSGMGLRWLGERLRAAHGDQAAVGLERLPAGGCHAHIALPLRTGGAA